MHASLTILLISLWIGFSASAPTGGENPSEVRSAQRVEELQNTWKGIYFRDAAKNCNDTQFEKILTTLNDSMELMSPSYPDLPASPGWNRFFMSDDYLPKQFGWGSFYHKEYYNILRIMQLVFKYPMHGNPDKWQNMKPRHRVGLTCVRPPYLYTGCDSENSRASTFSGRDTEDGYGNIVWFCPAFFDDSKRPRVTDLHKAPKEREANLENLKTRAYLLVHEFFHCRESMGMDFFIDDIRGVTPETKGEKKYIYGSQYSADFAWKNTYLQSKSKWRPNLEVAENADNYAWFYTYNYFHQKYGWKGDGFWEMNHDELRRTDPDEQQIFDDPGYTVNESDIHIPSPTQTPTSTGGVPPDPTPTAQMIFVYEWIDTPEKLQSWQITDIAVGKPLDWCSGSLLPDMVAAQSINGTDVPNPIPFPSNMDFWEIDYGGKPGYKQCSYRGNSDAPGTFDCPDFTAPVQCGKTPNVRKLITCPAKPNLAKSWAVSMVICQWGKSNVKE